MKSKGDNETTIASPSKMLMSSANGFYNNKNGGEYISPSRRGFEQSAIDFNSPDYNHDEDL